MVAAADFYEERVPAARSADRRCRRARVFTHEPQLLDSAVAGLRVGVVAFLRRVVDDSVSATFESVVKDVKFLSD